MKITYIWHDDPEMEKVYDTANGYSEHIKICRFLHTTPMTKKEWDEFEKAKLLEKYAKGLVLAYAITNE